MQISGLNGKMINISAVSVIFPDDAELNLTAYDMGENLVELNFEGDVVNRLKVAFGTNASANISIDATANIQIRKLSAASDTWHNRVWKRAIIKGLSGTCIITDDVGKEYKLEACSIGIDNISANGQDASYTFSVKGIITVNEDLWGVIEVA